MMTSLDFQSERSRFTILSVETLSTIGPVFQDDRLRFLLWQVQIYPAEIIVSIHLDSINEKLS